MPVLNEDTFALMCHIEANEALYDDCHRITLQAIERHPPRGDVKQGIGVVAAAARNELSTTLRRVIVYSDDSTVQSHLAAASIDWRDVAREFIADVLCGNDK
jgi:hypothetical protein